jgi:hypothetical protein
LRAPSFAIRLGLIAALACLVVVPAARADGDPASDYLLGLTAFVPPDDGIPSADGKQLVAVLATAKEHGFQIRVALIGTRYDMGSVALLFRQPRLYAHFLGQELAFVYKGRLLVAMPNGYGVSRDGKLWPAGQALVNRLPPPEAGGHGLATGAIAAVVKLAAASGVTVAAPKPAGSPSSGNDRLLIGIVGLVLVAGTAATVGLRRRRRT